MRETEQITVFVAGEAYTLLSDEGSARIEGAAQQVDILMKQISTRVRSDDMRRVAVLAAIKLAHELKELQQSHALNLQKATGLLELVSQELDDTCSS